MAGLVINHITGKFEYNFDKNSIIESQNIKGIDIPFNALDEVGSGSLHAFLGSNG